MTLDKVQTSLLIVVITTIKIIFSKLLYAMAMTIAPKDKSKYRLFEHKTIDNFNSFQAEYNFSDQQIKKKTQI